MALCSCCSCCCHDLQLMQAYNRKDLIARSEYIAVIDLEKCIHCGKCAERCVFGARTFANDQMQYNAAECLGCGLCVTSCPTQATTMQLRGI
jgi:Na+-translocating ferredoxin:NAD+ oxidoreductase RNF subunit RnfB